MPYDRFLLDPDTPGARTYEIRRHGVPSETFKTDPGVLHETFKTGGVNGKSPDDTAIGNLLDYSDHHHGTFSLVRDDGVTIASANSGIGVESISRADALARELNRERQNGDLISIESVRAALARIGEA